MTLESLTTADIQAELTRRQQSATSLQVRREKLLVEIEGIDRELRDIGVRNVGAPRASRSHGSKSGEASRKRPRNDITLPDAIARVTKVRAVVTPKQAAQLVLDNGYKTMSKTFGIQVATTLARDERFKRVGRGQYERLAHSIGE